MSNVIIDREKIDILANAISDKSGVPVTMTLAEMVEAVDSIETGGGGITPTGNINITQAGVTDVTNYATATVPSNVVIDNGINGSFITINGARKWDATAWFDYSQNGIVEGGINYASKNIRYNAVASGTTVTPTTSAQTIGGANYMMEGAVTVNAVPSASVVDDDYTSEFYYDGGTRKWHTRYWVDYSSGGFIDGVQYGGYLVKNAVPSNTSVTPTESSQTIGGTNYMMEGAVTVNAIPSTYVGSDITQRSSSDLTASGATVTVPSGFYSAQASKTVTTMTLPTSAASSATSGYTSKATIGRSTAAQYINIPPGYNSTGAYYVISAVANGSAKGPSSLSGSSATVSTGTNTLTLTKTGVTTTPTVTAGYVSSATASTATVTLTASVTTKAAATITPTTTNQTIAAGTYLTGIQTIAGDADLIGSNILSTANIFGVQGTVVVQNYYTGSSAPSSSLGSNGDLYLQA